jgi:hypothetical protein
MSLNDLVNALLKKDIELIEAAEWPCFVNVAIRLSLCRLSGGGLMQQLFPDV